MNALDSIIKTDSVHTGALQLIKKSLSYQISSNLKTDTSPKLNKSIESKS